jgi:hypothetical protein
MHSVSMYVGSWYCLCRSLARRNKMSADKVPHVKKATTLKHGGIRSHDPQHQSPRWQAETIPKRLT